MPLAAQGGPGDIDAFVRNGAGQAVDPPNLSVTIRALNGDLIDGPHSIPPIVRLSAGHYGYTWAVPDDQALGSYGVAWIGTDPTTAETIYGIDTIEVVPAGYIGTGPYDILVKPTDYDGIRALLGVTTVDVGDDDIELVPFLPSAVLSLQDSFTTEQWALMFTSDTYLLRLRLAAMNCTAARLAETKMRGGTMGQVRPTEQPRNWPDEAAKLSAACSMWVNSLLAEFIEVLEPGADEFDFKLLHRTGPTRARFRVDNIQERNWWQYPPVVGVPPNWPWPEWPGPSVF